MQNLTDRPVVIQVARATQTEQGQVEQVIQLVPDRLRFTVDHARGGFRLRDDVWSLGACQARLDGLDHAEGLLGRLERVAVLEAVQGLERREG